ncbi:MAG: membrane dipeptidase [Aquisalinus sp.]|nr:membrane dipeptidase [Aquisalinus sp.]
MSGLLKVVGGLAVLLLVLAALALFWYLPVKADRDMNVVKRDAPISVSEKAAKFHDDLRGADLHSDMLLWMRDPSKRHSRGHTDLPRLREGRVAVQVFASVTKTPAGQNYEENTAESDQITLLAIAQRWPIRTWDSIYERARYHAERLFAEEAESDGNFVVALTKRDLADALAKRETDKSVLVGILATEGSHPLEGDIDKLQGLYDAGYRMIGLHHFFDNELGGSLHGVSGEGLTPFGREVVLKLVEMDIMIDVAHSSHQVVRDVLEMTDEPLVVSHTGIYSACNSTRNIPDDLMAEIAARGGLIGIGFWADVTCNDAPVGIANVIKYAADKFGVEHIALGSDYDGTVTTTFDASELSVLTEALLEKGMSEEDVRLVMGENAIRFFSENLPD